MVKSTRSSYSCARCYKRKKKCDRSYPSCTQCKSAKAQCVALDRESEEELPRSLVSYLEAAVAQLELERERLLQVRQNPNDVVLQQEQLAMASAIGPTAASHVDVTAAYELAAKTASQSAPVVFLNNDSEFPLPYYRAFFLGAELPFPLAFQEQRMVNVPNQDGGSFTQLPEEVADQLMTVYVERILPRYPLFLKQDLFDMFQRFKMSSGDSEVVTSDEQFIICMIMAIATLTSKARDYRKLVSVAESLRRDAFVRLNFELSYTKATTTTIQQLLLLAQYGFLFPASTNLWQVVGDATRIALGLGLHQETPKESGMAEEAVAARKRLYWTLYAMERSVAITSHRPLAVAGDHVHLPFPLSDDDTCFESQTQDTSSDTVDQGSTQEPHLGFAHSLQFLRLQSEICSVNIGMRPIPNVQFTHEDWLADVERRAYDVKASVTSDKKCDFMIWHTMLILHMPCARNPGPTEKSILKCFDAAVRIAKGYWELIVSNDLEDPWHATHHCYEAGILILYGLWHHRALIRLHYTIAQIFEIVHQVSGFFILLAKQWPAAQQCGMLFDRLRKGPLSFFREEASSDASPGLEARQLKELVFRENADVLYAREKFPDTIAQSTLETMFPDFDVDPVFLENSADILDFFNFFDAPDLEGFEPGVIEDEVLQPEVTELSAATESPCSTGSRHSGKPVVDKAQLRAAMAKLPICSHCKRRRIKCDMNLPSCRNCTKLQKDCCYWDNALSEETSRRHLHALHEHVQRLMDEAESVSSSLDVGESALGTQAASADLIPLETRMNEFILPNILCSRPSSSGCSGDLIFFGPTSSFSRLANIGIPLPLPSQVAEQIARSTGLFETLRNSLKVDVTAEISNAEARNLSWLYHRSIEITYPVLGRDLIIQTLGQVYGNTSMPVDGETVTRARFEFIMAISLALLGSQDTRLKLVADAYFRKAITRASSSDLFVHPTNQSLQMILLLCIYVWIRPEAMDLWRLLGHASRMYLDIIEVHGSGKTESAYTGLLYRTLYTLETQTAIAFGRPSQLPDVTAVSICSPDSISTAVGDVDLSTMVYNLARLQSRFYRDMIGTDWASSQHSLGTTTVGNTPWMAACIHDMNTWIDNWNAQVEALFIESPVLSDEQDLREPLRLYGKFHQCEALLLASMAAETRGQLLVSRDEQVVACKELLRVADCLRRTSTPTVHQTNLVFGLTWTRAHSVFTAATTLLQLIHNNLSTDSEMQGLVRTAIDILSLECNNDQGTSGLVRCLQNMYESNLVSTTI